MELEKALQHIQERLEHAWVADIFVDCINIQALKTLISEVERLQKELNKMETAVEATTIGFDVPDDYFANPNYNLEPDGKCGDCGSYWDDNKGCSNEKCSYHKED